MILIFVNVRSVIMAYVKAITCSLQSLDSAFMPSFRVQIAFYSSLRSGSEHYFSSILLSFDGFKTEERAHVSQPKNNVG